MKVNLKSKEERRKRVYEFYIENITLGKSYTVKHFLAEKIPKRTIYDIIQLAENDFGYERKNGSGRIAKKMPRTKVTKLKTMFDDESYFTLGHSSINGNGNFYLSDTSLTPPS